MGIMNDHDAIRAFTDGLKIAASTCEEMAKFKKSKEWRAIGQELTQFRLNGEAMYRERKMTRMMLENQCDSLAKSLGAKDTDGKGIILQ